MKWQYVAMATLQREQLQGNLNVKRPTRQAQVEEEYDIELEEGDNNEDDCLSMNEHKRIRPSNRRNRRRLVQNL